MTKDYVFIAGLFAITWVMMIMIGYDILTVLHDIEQLTNQLVQRSEFGGV